MTTIHKVLPHAVSGVLSIERFQSQPSHICVLEIINKVAYLKVFSRCGETPYKKTGVLIVPLGVKKADFVSLRVFSLKRSTAGAFTVHCRVLRQKSHCQLQSN